MRGRGEGTIRQRHRADGTVYWEARVAILGRRVSFYDVSTTAAAAKARQARADAERGMAPAGLNMTVEEYLGLWLHHVQPALRARTFTSYQSHRRLYIVPAFGRVRLSQLTPSHIERLLAKLLGAGLSPSTVTRVRATLSMALNQARRDFGLPRNVASLARCPRATGPPSRRRW